MIGGWYIPSWNGDFRIVADGDSADRSVLEVVNPTIDERATLEKALVEMKARGWIDVDPQLGDPKKAPLMKRLTGRAKKKEWSFPIGASIERVGALFAGLARPGPAVLTAIQYVDGKVITTSGGPAALDALAIDLEKARGYREQAEVDATKAKTEADEAKAKEARDKLALAKKEEPKAIVTVRRPTPCCPECQPGAVTPASEVLLAFLSPEEHESWAKERAIVVRGGLTGHRYMIAHRNSPLAVRNTKICRDLDHDCVIHFHDWRVPPEEEVLAAKLILEHREPWLRNEATCFGSDMKFKNPFGDIMDGTRDASFCVQIGKIAQKALIGAVRY